MTIIREVWSRWYGRRDPGPLQPDNSPLKPATYRYNYGQQLLQPSRTIQTELYINNGHNILK